MPGPHRPGRCRPVQAGGADRVVKTAAWDARASHLHGAGAHGGGVRPAQLTPRLGAPRALGVPVHRAPRAVPWRSPVSGVALVRRLPEPQTCDRSREAARFGGSDLSRAHHAAYVGPVTTRATSEMTYRQLGDSGLTVSTVGLGCNNFGRRLDQEGTTAVVNAAIDAGVTLFDTADIYGLGASEELLGAALGRQREHVVVATKFGMDMQGANGPDWGVRGSRRYIRTRRRGEPAPARHRLDRPLPAAPPRPAHADRRDARGARRARARGQGALHRQQQPHRLAGRRRRLDGAERRHRALRLGAERVLAPRARRRGGARAGLRARRGRACCRSSRSRRVC